MDQIMSHDAHNKTWAKHYAARNQDPTIVVSEEFK